MNNHSFQVSPDLFRWDAKRLNALLAGPSVASLVASWVIAKIVRQSVNLNRDTSRLTEEIEHEWPKGVLPPELQSLGS